MGPANCEGKPGFYGIRDFPCDSVQDWVKKNKRVGHRVRQHAWHLFIGVNQNLGGELLWQTWPTATQVIKHQFDAQKQLPAARLELAPLTGGRLERPTPETPRTVGEDAAAGDTYAEKLALPGAPLYEVPDPVRKTYSQCVRTGKDGPFLIDGKRFQNNTDVMVAAVVYDPVAANGIQGPVPDEALWDASFLDSRVPKSATSGAAFVPMPNNSIVLKAMLWPVPYDRYVPLPLWDCPDPDADWITVEQDGKTKRCEVYAGFENPRVWPRGVALIADPNAPVESRLGPVTYLKGVGLQDLFDLECRPRRVQRDGLTYVGLESVSLDRFYTIRFSSEDFQDLDDCDKALLDQSARWSYGRDFDQRDVLVLVALHVMTKEQVGWTFQSAWWSYKDPTGRCEEFADDRPAPVEGDPLSNYLLTTTYGMTQKTGQHRVWPKELPSGRQRTDYWPLAYNPYIELAAGHPIETNCINCHHRAAWPSRLTTSREYPDRSSAYLAPGAKAPGLLRKFTSGDEITWGLLLMDSMWSVSDRAHYPRTQQGAAGDPANTP